MSLCFFNRDLNPSTEELEFETANYIYVPSDLAVSPGFDHQGQMEDSEKRRERLKAMRTQADQAQVSSNVEHSGMPGCLSNPLIEASAPTVVQESSTPRFDFYTDPMSAFSDSKKRGNADNQIRSDFNCHGGSPLSWFSPSHPGPRSLLTSPTPAHQIQSSWSSNHTIYEAQGYCHSPSPHRSPMGTTSPFPMHPQTPEGWNGSVGPTGFSFPSNPPRGGRLPSPGFGPPGSQCFNAGQGRGQWVSHSPSPGSGQRGSPNFRSGRGGGYWYGSSMSPGSGWSSGRGRGSHARVSAMDRQQGPEIFFNESMLDDPWKFLKPVTWRSMGTPLSTPYSSKTWTETSHGTKKARVSEASNKSNSQPSLAEYLAASFNAALDEAANE